MFLEYLKIGLWITTCSTIYLGIGLPFCIHMNENWRWYAHASDYSTGTAWALFLLWPAPWLVWAVFRHYLHRPDEEEWMS